MTSAATRGLAAAIAGAFRMPRGVSSMHHTAGAGPTAAIAAPTGSAASTLGTRTPAAAPAPPGSRRFALGQDPGVGPGGRGRRQVVAAPQRAERVHPDDDLAVA